MEKSILVRRKAQKLAREGRTGEAIEQLRKLDSEAEVDPYDHVFIGDLLLRQGHREEAVEALLEAVSSYRRVGLNRSAIAICKKILRLGDPTALVSRTLGDLYLSEELHTEAVQHLLRYLDGIPPDTSPPEEFFETLDKVASISGLQVEAALRLSDHFQRVRREDRAAELLERVADQAGAVGLAGDLREKARHLHAQFVARRSSGGEAGSAPGGLPEAGGELIPNASDLSSPEASCVLDDDLSFGIGLDDLIGQADTSDGGGHSGAGDDAGILPDDPCSALPDPGEALESPGEAECGPERDEIGEETTLTGGLETGGFEVEHFRVSAGVEPGSSGQPTHEELPESDAGTPALTDWRFSNDPVEASVDVQADGDHVPPEDIEEKRAPEPDDDELIGQAAAAFESEDWDQAGEVRCLIQLGDAYIAEEEYEKALEAFIEVVRLDPDNSTGRRRLIRFREMGVRGADQGPEEEGPGRGAPEGAANRDEELLPGVLESGSTSVTVASEPARSSDEWVDLGALLEEFKTGVQNQIDGDDFQSHYDLAVSHRTMGLHMEAMEELDSILGNGKLPTSMAWICRELRGECLADMGRHADAIEELRRTLELPVDDEQRRWSVLYNLARVMESAGEWREAEETYERLIAEAPGFLDARQRRLHCRERYDPESRAA